jgi:hypothetical protein
MIEMPSGGPEDQNLIIASLPCDGRALETRPFLAR